jgi:hypothetical protein
MVVSFKLTTIFLCLRSDIEIAYLRFQNKKNQMYSHLIFFASTSNKAEGFKRNNILQLTETKSFS